MTIGFLIITYGYNYLEECILSIRRFYDYPIYIIDNNIDNKNHMHFFGIFNNVYYFENYKNNYELGAIWFGCKQTLNIEKLIILHNSMILLEKLPFDIEEISFMSFWKTIAADYSPTIFWVKNKLKEMNIEIEYDSLFYSVSGCVCIIETKYLQKLMELGFDKIYAMSKQEAVGTEILFGYLITYILKINNVSLFNNTLQDNVSGIVDWKYIKKIGGGQGICSMVKSINLSTIELFNKIFDENLLNNHNKNDCYIQLINIIDNDENIDIQNFLINHVDYDLIYPDNAFDVIDSIRHRLCTKYFFPTYYAYEKKLIMSYEKYLFETA